MPLIAMPREMGTLGKDVAARVAQRLGKTVVHHEIIDPLANKMRLRKSHVVRFLDGKAGLLERMNTDDTSLSIYTADEILRLAAAGGSGVVRGWGAVHLLGAVPHVIRVRVCAPLELRVERMMARLNTRDRVQVQKEIELSDEAATAITRRHFNIDWRDAVHYDLVLNTERVAVDDCAEQILALAAQARFGESDASRGALADLAIAARVRAALRSHDGTRRLDILIASTAGNVTLSGIVGTQEEFVAAGGIAAAVEGVSGVSNQLQHTQRGFRRMGG